MTAAEEHRLPGKVRPSAYRLVLEPDLETFAVRGEVAVDVDVREAVREIVLNAAELEIGEASVGGTRLEARLDAARERVTLVAKEPLAPGRATLTLRFTGTISEKMRGFYRSTYARADGTRGVMATTQFEATSARRCFPCFDEPAFKATFDVTLVVPDERTAISNMPVAAEEPAGAGRRRVRFERTPVMSTYLLAFAVGEFESIEARTRDGVPVRVCVTPGRARLGRFALETAVRGLEWFDEYYGIPYRGACPKLDLLAIPDFEYGAMENWGAITFRETAILVDPERSSVPQRRRVAEVVLHELAHQWFGNLVSPEWWSYLWLNESFATFMAYKAADALFPEWRMWEEYAAAITSAGKALDSLRSSHPVEVPVGDPSEVDQIFDAISYNKGGSVLRMLEQAIGEEAFRRGVRRYLERHAYACATTDDLWRALGEGTGVDARSMMDGWTRRTGLPVVTAARAAGGLRLRQERFFLDRDPGRPAADPALWEIPIAAADAAGRRTAARLVAREAVVEAPPADWIKLNAGQTGFFLVQYDEEGWRSLAGAVQAMALPALDRHGLQEDAYSLMRAGYLPVPEYLRLAGAYAREENPHVWAGLTDGVAALAEIFLGDPLVPRLEAWACSLIRPVAERVGWDEREGEAHDRLLLRSRVLGAAVRLGEPGATGRARRLFEEAVGGASIPPNLRSVVYAGAARHGGEEALDRLIGLYEKSDLPEVKVQLLGAMGASLSEGALRRAAAFSLSGRVRAQDAMFVWAGVPIETRRAAWALLKEHWATLDQRYGKTGLIGRFIVSAAAGIPSEEHARDVEAFFRGHPAPFATEKIKQTLEGIRARARFRERNRDALAKFFEA